MEQIIIATTGIAAIWLTQDRRLSHRRWACIVGIIGQPFWIASTYNAEQWGMLALSVFYTIAWLKGIKTHWLHREQ